MNYITDNETVICAMEINEKGEEKVLGRNVRVGLSKKISVLRKELLWFTVSEVPLYGHLATCFWACG
jgi:hypothetical protein